MGTLSDLVEYWTSAAQEAADKASGRYVQTYDAQHGAGAADAAVQDALNGNPRGLNDDLYYEGLYSGGFTGDAVPDTSGNGGGHGGGHGRVPSSSPLVYVDAPLAAQYHMDRNTAYQEALAGSAHQREVQDLLKAGLNPVLSANAGSGASVFSGSVPVSGGSYGGRSHNSAKDDNSFGSFIGDLVTVVTGKSAVGNASGRIVDRAVDMVSP